MFYLGLMEVTKSLENENKIIKGKRPKYVFGNYKSTDTHNN
jgi:hypothetical protein